AWMNEHQPQLHALNARGREAQAAVRDARLLPNPTLTMGVGGITFGHRNPSNISASSTQNYQVTVAETLELGKRGHRIRSAELHAKSLQLEGQFEVRSILADARESLARLVYLKERQRVLRERLASAQGIVQLDQTRLDRGDVSGIDHSRLELDVVNVERELADNEGDYQATLAACTALLGSPCEADLDSEQLEWALPAPQAGALPAFHAERRPDVESQRIEAEAQLEQARLAGNRAIPDPQVGISYLHDNLIAAGNQPDSFGVFVALPLPISDHGQHQRTQALERAEQFSAEARRRQIQAAGEAEYIIASERVLSTKLEMLKARALPLGVKVLDATETAYRLGQVSMTDLLLARRQRAELALDLVETRFALFQVRSQARRVLGLDPATRYAQEGIE
ncbi:MAG TPA: TolC family protein, partial [Polyangiaceae bacterium]